MAIPGTGARNITIDGRRYRWRVRGNPTYCQQMAWSNLTLAAEALGVVGSVLIVALPQAHPSNLLGEEIIAVLPADVAAHVRDALAAGWQPFLPGKPFLMNATPRQLEITTS